MEANKIYTISTTRLKLCQRVIERHLVPNKQASFVTPRKEYDPSSSKFYSKTRLTKEINKFMSIPQSTLTSYKYKQTGQKNRKFQTKESKK